MSKTCNYSYCTYCIFETRCTIRRCFHVHIELNSKYYFIKQQSSSCSFLEWSISAWRSIVLPAHFCLVDIVNTPSASICDQRSSSFHSSPGLVPEVSSESAGIPPLFFQHPIASLLYKYGSRFPPLIRSDSLQTHWSDQIPRRPNCQIRLGWSRCNLVIIFTHWYFYIPPLSPLCQPVPSYQL
jgi:hypothetical protein